MLKLGPCIHASEVAVAVGLSRICLRYKLTLQRRKERIRLIQHAIFGTDTFRFAAMLGELRCRILRYEVLIALELHSSRYTSTSSTRSPFYFPNLLPLIYPLVSILIKKFLLAPLHLWKVASSPKHLRRCSLSVHMHTKS